MIGSESVANNCENKNMLVISLLSPGDIIFSTTADKESEIIRSLTSSKFSHASVYYENGVIVEANDKGVGPTKIEVYGQDAEGNLVGLPYPNWTSIVVLRCENPQEERMVVAKLTKVVQELIGLDYPSMMTLVSAAGWMRLPLTVFALIKDSISFFKGEHPLVEGMWCSQLAGVMADATRNANELAATRVSGVSPEILYNYLVGKNYLDRQECVVGNCKGSFSVADGSMISYNEEMEEACSRLEGIAGKNRAKAVSEAKLKNLKIVKVCVAVLTVFLISASVKYLAFNDRMSINEAALTFVDSENSNKTCFKFIEMKGVSSLAKSIAIDGSSDPKMKLQFKSKAWPIRCDILVSGDIQVDDMVNKIVREFRLNDYVVMNPSKLPPLPIGSKYSQRWVLVKDGNPLEFPRFGPDGSLKAIRSTEYLNLSQAGIVDGDDIGLAIRFEIIAMVSGGAAMSESERKPHVDDYPKGVIF